MSTITYGSLTIPPAFPVRGESIRVGISSPAASGVVQSRQLSQSVSENTGQARIRRWGVVFPEVSAAEKDAILAAHEDAMGDALPILWEPPPPYDGAQIPVRFVTDGKLTVEYKGSAKVFSIECELEEVI